MSKQSKYNLPVKVAQGHTECSGYDRVKSHHFYHSHHHSHYYLLRSPKGIRSAPEMIELTVIIFITLIINSHHHSHYHSRYYLLRSPKGIHSAPDMIESTGLHHRRSCNAERLITWIWDSHIKTFTSWSKFCGFVSKKKDSPHQRLQI